MVAVRSSGSPSTSRHMQLRLAPVGPDEESRVILGVRPLSAAPLDCSALLFPPWLASSSRGGRAFLFVLS
ncbi:hypothetical protein EYF80_043338 [Liparis tanakae]|uniref:Uncharacterized protein n=1 Tax=Liparis tanakae TaxID=230148 RepID=A0A4Z2G003_9TELE|nr:hypothetical protein EYF80_043338 [Liparis tanakae]